MYLLRASAFVAPLPCLLSITFSSRSQLGREGNSSRADAIALESGPGMTFSPAAMGCGSVAHFPTPLGFRSPRAKRWQYLHPAHRLLCR